METAIISIINGVVLSSLYILVGLGFALLLSIVGIFNFAHGAIYMLGAYLTFGLAVAIGLNQWASLLLSVVLIGLFGLFLERFCFRPFKGNQSKAIIMAIALILIFEAAVAVTLGGVVRALPPFVPGIVKIGFISSEAERWITFIVGGVLLIILTLIIQKTKLGKQMLAVAQDMEGAELQGISVNRTAAIATVMACSMAALAGSLMAALFSMNPYMGDPMLLKAIQVVILSGIGSIGGVLFGGLIIGFLDAILPIFSAGSIAQVVTLGIIIIILLVRPKGLFGYELF